MLIIKTSAVAEIIQAVSAGSIFDAVSAKAGATLARLMTAAAPHAALLRGRLMFILPLFRTRSVDPHLARGRWRPSPPCGYEPHDRWWSRRSFRRRLRRSSPRHRWRR